MLWAVVPSGTGLPQVAVGKERGGSTFDSDVLTIPQVTDTCRDVAEASHAYSNMVAAEHFQQQLQARKQLGRWA